MLFRLVKRVLLIILAVFLAWLGWEWFTFPDVAELATERPATTAFMEQRKRLLRSQGKSDALQWTWVPYEKISPYLRRGVLVAEDNQFYEHEGVDVDAVKDAIERDWKRRKLSHGGSTITQQLAKNLYLSPSRNPLRKLREYFIARSLEKHLSKKRILEIYLNVVEMGERVYGAEAAARHYFKKSAAGLTAREAALLAGCLPNPRVMNPGDPNKRLRARQRMILSRMKRWGYLFEREVLAEKKPAASDPPVADTVAPVETDAETDTADSTDTTGTVDTTDTAETTDTTETTETVEPAVDTAATTTT